MEDLNRMEKDTIIEVSNAAFTSGASVLSHIFKQAVSIAVSGINTVESARAGENLSPRCLLIKTKYLAGFQGNHILIFSENDAAVITSLVLKAYQQDYLQQSKETELSALTEVMNQMMGASTLSMAELFQRQIENAVPVVQYIDLSDVEELQKLLEIDGEVAVEVSFRLEIEHLLDSTFIQVTSLKLAREMANTQGRVVRSPAAGKPVQEPDPEEEPDEADKSEAVKINPEEETVKINQLELVKDIPVTISVIFGKKKVPLRRLLAMKKGGIIEVDRYAGEPVEILVRDKTVARGEIVMVNEQFGVRITSIETRVDHTAL